MGEGKADQGSEQMKPLRSTQNEQILGCDKGKLPQPRADEP